MKSLPRLVLISVIGWSAFFVLLVGCQKSVVEAVPRESVSRPVFGSETTSSGELKSNGINFDFIHPDHFACLSLNVEQLIKHDEFKDVSWGFLEQQMAEMVGPANAELQMIERVWLLLDRESVSMAMEGNTDGLFVTVIQYKENPDLDALASASAARRNFKADSNKPQLVDSDSNGEVETPDQPNELAESVAEAIGEKTIAIGIRQFVAKTKGPHQASELSRQLSKLDFSADVKGFVTAGPIREALRSAFGLAAQFGGKAAKKFASLPDVLEQIEFSISLDAQSSDDLLNIKATIDDPQMIEEVVRLAQQSIAQQTNSPSDLNGGAAGGKGSVFGNGILDSTSSSDVIFPMSMALVTQRFVEEISEGNLFTVEGADGSVAFRLSRPGKTSELLTALVADSKRAAEFAQRLSKMKKIATALERYHETYGAFPPPGVVAPDQDSAKNNSIPPQLNWRVGLLPFLSEQALYDQFDFEQSWDSKHNRRISESIPDVFSVTDSDSPLVSRFHLPGAELGLFSEKDTDGAEPKTLADISDRKMQTAIVVESNADHEVMWTKPSVFLVGKEAILGSESPLGRADESGVLFISAAFEPRVVRKNLMSLIGVLTPQGGEKLTRGDFVSSLTD